MRWQAVAVVLTLSSLATAEPAQTQPPAPARPYICIRGTNECRTILLMELGLGTRYQLVSPESPDFDTAIEWGAGLLVNRSPRDGVGGSISSRLLDGIHGEQVLALRARYRYWLTREDALEASAGVLLGHANGVTIDVGIEVYDHIALVLDLDLYDSSYPSGLALDAGLAIRFGGYAALPAMFLTAYALGNSGVFD